MIGRTLNHYRILEPLGSGGMGQVWLAQDTKLHRKVALKVLPAAVGASAERRSRFEREARAVAALNHPNIVTIYSVEEADGVHFITMELVAGKTLGAAIPASGMDLQSLLGAAIPLAEAVGAAHELGIVHRDIKPENVVLSDRGVLKVLDFGLAKLRDEAPQDVTSAPTTLVTAEGRIVGTVAYMSPEQAEGKAIDARSDVFSLGVTLYQMATGRRPFAGETSLSTLTAILRDTPTPITDSNPGLPPDLGLIISRCLAKAPDDRFNDARELSSELAMLRQESLSGSGPAKKGPQATPGSSARVRRTVLIALGVAALLLVVTVARVVLGPPGDSAEAPEPPEVPQAPLPPGVSGGFPAPGPTMSRIVVLPFKNLGHAEDAYFAAGVTEEITSRLASVTGLAVISATTAERYAATGSTIAQIGAALDVSHVLEGTVQWDKGSTDGGRVRVTPRLIRVTDDTQVWSERYDRAMAGIFEVQSEIASKVVAQLGVSLGASAQKALAALPTRNMEAYQEYLKGIRLFETSVSSDTKAAVEHLAKAVALDPTFVEALAKLSVAHTSMHFIGIDPTESRLVLAREAADKALAIAADGAEPLIALGYYYYWGRRDYEQALATFERAAAGRPPSADVLAAIAYIKRRQGRWDESTEGLEAALKLDPASSWTVNNLWESYIRVRDFDKAEGMCPRLGMMGKEMLALCHARVLAMGGAFDKAAALLEPIEKPESPYTNVARWGLATFLGRHEEAMRWASLVDNTGDSQALPPRDLLIAWNNHWLGREDEARRGYEKVATLMSDRLKRGQDPVARQYLSQAYAGLGRKEDALREATLAADMVSLTRDALDGPDYLDNLAQVYAAFGEKDRALDLIDQVLDVPSQLTVPILEHHPIYDPLRDHPRYREIIRKHK